ncbi:MAG: DUF1656 domain-containing protein [Beijerinckiaceae bacterium]|nr:DUF1656 domain-containing protein [Beijerinckiaceae bacterium]
MTGEIDLYGVFVPVLLVHAVLAFVLFSALRLVLTVTGFYRLIWHRPLVDVSLFVIVLATVAANLQG